MDKSNLPLKYFSFDIFASLIVWVLFVVFRNAINNITVFENLSIVIPTFDYLTSILLFPFYCAFVHYLTGFYRNPIKNSRVTVFVSTFVSALFISNTVFLGLMLPNGIVSYEYFYSSILVLFGLLFTFTVFFRLLVFSQVHHYFATKVWTINTLIIGTNSVARKIADDIEEHAHYNTFTGFISTNKQQTDSSDKVLGDMSQISNVIKKYDIQEAIVALDENADEKQLFNIINLLYQFDIDIQFTPRLYEILTGSAKISHMGTIPLVSITQLSMSDWQACVKRFLDIIISILALLLTSPLLFYFMFRIKKDSKGPVFYRQERIGRYGRVFNILKFRTMQIDSEGKVPQLSSEEDERITEVGKFFRKYRIDEIPQFWNILKGDMSLVGPRPERKFYINQIITEAPYYCLLYKIRPGLTSWGPIKIGYTDTIDKMIERLNYDIIYLEKMSLFNDIKILIYTFETILKGKGI